MIDVSPYIDKLEKLLEYVYLRIDRHPYSLTVNYESIPKMSPADLLRLWNETGYLFICMDENEYKRPYYSTISFEEWYETRYTLKTKQ